MPPTATAEDQGTAPANDQRSLLQKLLDRRSELANEIVPLIEQREKEETEFEARAQDEDESKRPTDEERAEFAKAGETLDEQLRGKEAEIKQLDVRIERQEIVEKGRELAARSTPSPTVEITHEPTPYDRRSDSKGPSYYLDFAARHLKGDARSKLPAIVDGYEERLEKHSNYQAEQLPKREQRRKRLAEERVEAAEREFRGRHGIIQRELPTNVFESRAPSREPGQGGYAVPPLWLIDEYLEYLRAGRVAANLCRQVPLPGGTDSINIPKLTTPTAVGIQTADNAPGVSQDIKDTYVNAAVKTLFGFADIPLQLIEQSPGQIIDRVITRDMMKAYDEEVDNQVIAGKGVGAPLAGGEIKGIYPKANWEANQKEWKIAGSTPTAQELFQFFGAIASKTATSRFNLQDFTFLCHPSRWFWFATGGDKNERPLVTNEDTDFGAFQVDALSTGEQTPFEGLAGRLPFGPRVYIDKHVPITDKNGTAGGGTEDVIVGAIWDDLWLFEGDVRMDVFDQTLSGTMEIRFRLYNYVTLLQRYGPSVCLGVGASSSPGLTEAKWGEITFR